MDRVADHDSRNCESAAEPRQRTQVLSPVASPLSVSTGCAVRAEFVRHGHADTAAANVKAEIARRIA